MSEEQQKGAAQGSVTLKLSDLRNALLFVAGVMTGGGFGTALAPGAKPLEGPIAQLSRQVQELRDESRESRTEVLGQLRELRVLVDNQAALAARAEKRADALEERVRALESRGNQ